MHTLKSTGSRDLVVHLPELLGRALAVTPDSSSHFRLLDLPADLLECLALYFDGKEGVRVLTVSSAFHDVFARSVWRVLCRKAIDVAEPTRSNAYTRYGRLVRKIDLLGCLYKGFDLHNWLELFPNTIVFGTDIQEDMSVKQKQLTFDTISGLHGLRVVELYLGSNQSPFDLEALAASLIARNQNSAKQPVRQINILFSATDHSEPWAAVHRFVDAVAVLSLESLRIEMSLGIRSPPTPAQFTSVRPYLVRMPHVEIYESDIDCFDEHNRRLFVMDGVSNIRPMCPFLTRITLYVCCGSPDIYDYKDITSANFPQLQSLDVSIRVCTNHADGNEDAALQKILNQHWPSVTDMRLCGSLNASVIDTAFLCNTHLTHVDLEIGHGMADEIGVFHIERVLASLSALSSITLRCHDGITLETQWSDYSHWEKIKPPKLLYIDIEAATITAQMLKLMTMLPKLVRVQFSECIIDNESAAIAILKQVHEDKTAHNSDTGGDDVDGLYPSSPMSFNVFNFDDEAPFWSCEVIASFVAAISQIESIGLFGYSNETVNAIRERFPNIELEYYYT
ncbi:hypothetical protein GQ42DRAFT_165375 [Ramicandelaber brevisporus]|nr:hypothetical protein GQ42DRAFT_165375 [Ramicandelaber brevisporus]